MKDEMIATEDSIQVTPPRPRKEKKIETGEDGFPQARQDAVPKTPFFWKYISN